MISLTHWLSPSVLHSLGWTLLHFLWQGTAIAALAAVLMSLCRQASARYILAVGALILMLAAPVTTFFFLASSSDEASMATSVLAAERPLSTAKAMVKPSKEIFRLSWSQDALALPWLVEAWLLGVAFFSLRSAGGFVLLEREKHRQSIAVSDSVLHMCRTLQRRLGLERTIRYCECQWLQVPAVIGWFRPIVLLPVTALTGLSEEQLQSIIVHELAHIRRLDPFVNVFQISVESLLFYHPAIWWINKRIRAEREHCCDDIAVSLCGNPVEYAHALTLMEEWRNAPALATAANGGPLSERVFRLLGLKSIGSGARSIGLSGGILCLTAALIAGSALLGVAHPKFIVRADEIRQAIAIRPQIWWAMAGSPQVSNAPAPTPKPSAGHPAAPIEQPATAASYIDGMKAAGLGDLTVDQLIAMKTQGVTPEYVQGLREQGMHPDADNVVSMRIQGVTPEYVRDVRGLGLNPDEDQIVSMRIRGVSPEYVRGLKEKGIRADVDDLISMRIQGVTPAYVQGLHDQGLQPDVDNLVSMRIQGVTSEYVRDVHALGLKPTVDDFISMRVQGVTPEYIKSLQSAGYKFDVDELVSAKIQGVTPEFIERARKHGFQNVPLDKLIQLKEMGILESPADL
jgi:beta-lactamase regulating signal transducer with metallopeptidase domain